MRLKKYKLNNYFKYILSFSLLIASVGLTAKEYTIKSAYELKQISLEAGDVVIMQNGKWEDQKVIFRGTGTQEAPITLKAETPGNVILTGTSTLAMAGEYLVVDGLHFKNGALDDDHVIAFRTSSSSEANHCRLTNCKIIDYNPESKDTEYKWVSLYGTYNRVDHCHFENKTHNGAMMVVWLDGDPNYHQIDSNYFGERPDLGYNGGETIRVGTSDYSMSDSYTTVEYNVFEACDGEIEIISNKSCNNVYRYNTFKNSEGCMTLRHGNDCEVYNNFFFGVNYKNCGGIRIIGENHKIYNNYFENIPGDEYRAAISITNGVPDSPLNRYFQVKNAQIVNNTLVNCKHPFFVGAGADDEKSLPPLDCHIANNVVAIYSSSTDQIFEYKAEPINMTYSNNMVYGAELGIEAEDGIVVMDPNLVESDFYRPTDTSKVIAFGTMDYDFVTYDIELQKRANTNDVGCDQLSNEEIGNKPLGKEDVGIGWANSLKEVTAAEGGSVLKGYIDNASDGDIIILSTTGGEYFMNETAILKADITIRAAYGLKEKPMIKAQGKINEFIQIIDGVQLNMEHLVINGGSTSDNAFSNVISVPKSSAASSISISNCYVHDFSDQAGAIVFAEAPLNKLQTSYSKLYRVNSGFVFNQVSATIIEIDNSTLAQFGREFLSLDEDLSSYSTVTINHCTIDSIAHENKDLKTANFGESEVNFSNNIISHGHRASPVFSIINPKSVVDYNAFWQCGEPSFNNESQAGENNWVDEDPMYAAKDQFVFSLLPSSFAIGQANDGQNLGDLLWDVNNGQPNNNALLESLSVNGELIIDFDPNILEYQVELIDTLQYQLVAETQDENALLDIISDGMIPDTAYVLVTAENGINQTEYVVMVNSIINSLEQVTIPTAIRIHPNPSSGIITIESDYQGVLDVYSSKGESVYQQKVSNYNSSINLSKLPQGIYYVQFISGSNVHIEKLIISN